MFDALDESGVDFVALRTDRRDASLVAFPLPSGAIEEIMSQLREVGVDTDQYTVVGDLEAALTSNFDELEKRFTEGPDAESRVARGELRTAAREIEPDRTMFMVQAVLSATVAAAGLLLDSAIAIVGSMVISPFTSSLLSAALGAIIGDWNLSLDGLKSQALGLALATIAAGGVGLVAREAALVQPNRAVLSMHQITQFSSPNLLLLTIAITAGAASAIALATNQGVVLAGVAVAAAVVPSAATVGLGLAWQQPSIAFGAFLLLLLNILSINVTSYVTFLLLGYRPSVLKDDR